MQPIKVKELFMSTLQTETDHPHWLEALGLLHIFRTLSLCVQPAKIGLALLTIVCTFLFGSALDIVWSAGSGVDAASIDRFILARETGQPYEAQSGDFGIFESWRKHSERSLLGLAGSSMPDVKKAEGTPMGAMINTYLQAKPQCNLTSLGYGLWWLISQHTLFFFVFGAGALLLWGLGGGAICRLAAVQFARGDRFTMKQGFTYARSHLFSGFALAPCIPLVFTLIVSLLLLISGMLLRIPFVGDLLGSVSFILSLIGGFIIAALLFGLFIGGHFLWPAVAAEGQDAYDAFSRGTSYAFTKPLKTILYTVQVTMFGTVSWIVLNWFTYVALSVTHLFVGIGSKWFGLWPHAGGEDNPVGKLQAIWSMSGSSTLYTWPDWSTLAWYEYISAFLVGLCVLLVVGLMFSLLASFYYCASTTLYFLLRRDIDHVDLTEVFMESYGGTQESAQPTQPMPLVTPSPPNSDISLPIHDNP